MRDEDFYGLAAREIAEQQFNQALMAKAYAFGLGDPDKTRGLYIGMRADQLKEEAVIFVRDAQARERLRKAADQAAREESERQRVAKENAIKKARRRQQEIEAQRAGDAWERGEDRWVILSTNGSADKGSATSPPPKPSQPSPPMSPEELDKVIESLKRAQNAKYSFW